KPFRAPSLADLSSLELVGLLGHRNVWQRSTARQLLAERGDRRVVPLLRRIILHERGPLALEALWALYVSRGFTEEFALGPLRPSSEDVRAWTLRLIGDSPRLRDRDDFPLELRTALKNLALAESSPVVRCQLACTCKRLPDGDAVSVLGMMLRHGEDADDPF